MPFLIVFGTILFLIGFVVKKFTLKEVDTTLCPSLQKEQEHDIEVNKKSSKILMIIGPSLAVIGIIGTLLF